MRWLWLAGGLLLAVAAAATWFAFHDPRFVAGLSAIAAAALWKALVPMLKRKTPEEEKEDNEAYLENRVMPTKQRPHPDEGGHR